MRHPCARQRSLRPSQLKPRVLTVRLRLSTVRSDRLFQPDALSCQLDKQRVQTAASYQNVVRRENDANFVIAAFSIQELVPGQYIMSASGGFRLSPDAVFIPVLHPRLVIDTELPLLTLCNRPLMPTCVACEDSGLQQHRD